MISIIIYESIRNSLFLEKRYVVKKQGPRILPQVDSYIRCNGCNINIESDDNY